MQALELLAIEDNDADFDLLRAYLGESTRIDAELDRAATLEEGLEALDGSRHDLVLLDLFLPDASAEETLERICQRASDAHVVALTGSSSPDLERTALHHGVEEFVPKDALDTELLERTLPRAVERDRLLRNLRLLQRGFDAVQEGVVFWDVRRDDSSIVYCNPAFTEMSGYEEEELLGNDGDILSCEETDEQNLERIGRAFERGEPLEVELVCSRKNGERFWNSVAFAPIERDDETVTHFVAFHRDVTRRVEAERKLRRYETLVEEATFPIVTSFGTASARRSRRGRRAKSRSSRWGSSTSTTSETSTSRWATRPATWCSSGSPNASSRRSPRRIRSAVWWGETNSSCWSRAARLARISASSASRSRRPSTPRSRSTPRTSTSRRAPDSRSIRSANASKETSRRASTN